MDVGSTTPWSNHVVVEPDGTIRIRSKDIRWIQRRWDLTGDAHLYFRDLAGTPRAIPSLAHVTVQDLDNSHVEAPPVFLDTD